MAEFNHCIAITLSVLFLLFVLGTFITVDNQDIPKQDIAKYTGYPSWHPPVDGLNGSRGNDEPFVGLLFYATIVMVSSFEFNKALGVYCLVTAFTNVILFWADIGKIWAAFGLIHNALEIIILVNMHYGGRIKSNTFIGFFLLYVSITAGISLFATWPYDALWFKMQGLCMDWALVIQFTRTYFNTKKHIKNESEVNPLIRDDDNDERGERNDVVYNSENGVIAHHPYQILLLIVASGFHIFAFGFTYTITYPAYAWFVYLDTQTITVLPRKVIYLPDTTRWKIVVVTICSIALSFLTTRLGLPSIG
ncbi:1303_t:CDS:2 [Diversispora eburnea]|uniref:1303_t:CDS:1 n=1 Tax=Diversispora eburnea TaxID=1213867 RepID=A0A9N8ZKC6_9GLOM|nr:1303_t:CDS:2 [Diversispora eburnea]